MLSLELRTINRIQNLLKGLNLAAQRRVVNYVQEKVQEESHTEMMNSVRNFPTPLNEASDMSAPSARDVA